MTADEIIREYHRATMEVKLCIGRELEKLEHVRDEDIRHARANLAVPEDLRERQLAAAIAYDQMKSAREERWIASHEDMYGIRRGAVES